MSNFHNKITFRQTDISDPDLPRVISPSIGMPTENKIYEVMKYYKIENHKLIGAYDDNVLVAVIGLEIAGKTATIKHIAVINEYRMKSIGRGLIEHVIDEFSLNIIKAETDVESVDFYKKCGFICHPFQGQYGTRYDCMIKL
jgi:GNAT superfamily N-acetyltransferase